MVQAGHLSGRDGDKVARTGFSLIQAEKLQHTKLVVHIHNKDKRTPILYLSQEDFATLGECWQYKK